MGMGSRLGGGGRLGMLKRFAMGMGGKSGTPLTWLLYDEFTTADAAPITSPRTCEPGPGVLTIIDTGDKLSISSGELTGSGVIGNYDPSGNSGAISAWSAGDSTWASVLDKSVVTDAQVGYVDNVATGAFMFVGRQGIYARFSDDLYIIHPDNTAIKTDDSEPSSDYTCGVCLRSAGGFYIKDGKLAWVDTNAAPTNLSAAFGVVANLAFGFDFFGELSLPDNGYSEWGADFSTVTDTKTNPASLTTFNCDADCHINETWTHENGKVVRLWFRFTDTSNYVELYTSGTTALTLRKDVLGSLSTVATFAGVLTDGVESEVDIVAEGSSVKVYVDGVLQGSSTIPELVNDTGGKISQNLATNDIVLTTHPNPALGIATDRVIALQAADIATHTTDFLAYMRGVTVPTGGTLQYNFRGTP